MNFGNVMVGNIEIPNTDTKTYLRPLRVIVSINAFKEIIGLRSSD